MIVMKKRSLMPNKKVKGLPVQFIRTKDGAILKRGLTEIKLPTKGAVEATKLILKKTSKKGGVAIRDVLTSFTHESAPQVKQLLEQLLAWGLLVPADSHSSQVTDRENNLDIFYSEFRENAAIVNEKLNQHRLVILGVNYISKQLSHVLRISGVENYTIVDFLALRNLNFFDDSGNLKNEIWSETIGIREKSTENLNPDNMDCLVATSDFGSNQVFSDLNGLCLQHKCHFFPIILQNMIGYIGPHIVPGETACFDCLHARQNSHIEDQETVRAIQSAAFEGQHFVGFHPSMAAILGDMAAFELTKFYGASGLSSKIGTLIEIDLLKPQVVTKKVLKIPRCPTCSPMTTRASTTPDKTVFIPLDWDER